MEVTRKDAFLDLFLVNREGLMSEVVIGDCLDHSNHKVIEFKICWQEEKCYRNFHPRKAGFRLHRELVNKLSWENAFEGAGVHQCWLLFKDPILRAQE